MDSTNGRTRRRLRPRSFVAATAAAAAVTAAISSTHPVTVEAAFSTPTFTSRARPSSSLGRLGPRSDGGSTAMSERLSQLRPLHNSCQPLVMSIDELLEGDLEGDSSKISQAKLKAFQTGSSNQSVKGRGLGSQSSQYGGIDSSLSVAQSSNMLGFQVEDFEPFDPKNENNDEEDALQFMVENFDNYQASSLEEGIGLPVVRAMDTSAVSQTSQRVAASLLKSGGTTQLGYDLASDAASSNGSSKPTPKSKTKGRGLPWLPTESQINKLIVVELRAALAERGLIMTGRKADLQERLSEWASDQDHKRVQERLSGLKDLIQKSKNKESSVSTVDVVEHYDVGALTDKRKRLTKEKKRSRGGDNNRGVLGLVDETYFNATATETVEVDEEEDEEVMDDDEDNSMVNEASITQLSKTFNAPSSNYSNRDVRKMYIDAKVADQAGNRKHCKFILSQLREATPQDMRVVRRLSRMEQEDGNLGAARQLLQHGLKTYDPDNAHLLHGLGQLERAAGNDFTAKKYFKQATKKNPSFPNPYHALGTLEHTHGNIRVALMVMKEGIKHCPKNHRLYHALGDVYLDANMLDLAEESYLAGLQHAPHWGKSFVYTSLSFVSYAQGHTRDCRTLLRQSLEINGGMHAQGVIALAQLEESEDNIQQAREVYRDAISRYETKRRKRSPYRKSKRHDKDGNDVFDTSSLVDGPGKQYSRSYAGDKWINVFKSWARMEEIHGTYETAHIVFSKAARLFPDNISLLIQWAELQAKNGDIEKARLLYEAACHRVGGRSAEPYRLFAEFEMMRKHFEDAQSILFRGAQAVAESSSSSSKGVEEGDNLGGKNGLARLFHTWGVCEYHLGSQSRSEQLFDDALRVTGSEEGDSSVRSLILYSMARLEFSRKEYLLAQHCIGLSLKENLLPGGNSLIWKLWSEIAARMGNDHLVTRCKEQALLRWEEEQGGAVSDLSRLLGDRGERDAAKSDSAHDNSDDNGRSLPERTGLAMKDMFRKTPWYSKVCPPSGRMDKNWYSGAKLWDL